MSDRVETNAGSLPPFSLSSPRFDLSSFWGRMRLFVQVEACEAKGVDISDLKASPAVNEKLWSAREIVESAIHPTSGEVLPSPFRVSAIAPVNIPIAWGMLTTPASNVPLTLGLHFINQSYNAGCNYFNRSGSDLSLQEMGVAYSLAVGSACSMAFGLGKLFERGPKSLARFGVAIPIVATAAASVSNLAFTRSGEAIHGIPVTDEEGNIRGHSKVAGMKAIAQTAIGRCCLVPAATLLLPTSVMSLLKSANLFPKNKRLALLLELGTIYAALQVALPAALAVFPQTLSMDANDLEEEFHSLKDSKGRPVKVLSANKGL